ncbi:MAG: tetratricopeptide repeat protein, partial [Planctomycetota bacterium]|nr:tetratricopeptide repeat protein [Planctomycetota bacterium]
EVLAQRGKKKEAEKSWNKVIDVYQALSFKEAEEVSADEFVEMGLSLIHLNRFKDADKVMFPQAEDQDPKCQSLLLEWGRIYQAKFNFPDARKNFRDVLEENPSFCDAMVALAENYLEDFQVGTGRYDLAERLLKKALAVNPEHAGAHTAFGSLWLSDGNVSRARKSFEKSLAINPANLRNRGLLAACAYLASDEESFRKQEAAALEVNSECAEFYHTISQAIEKRFRYKDAARMSEKALAVNPDYWPAFHTLGINLLRIGQEEKARFYLDKSRDKDPFNIYVFNTRKLLRHMDKGHRELKKGNLVLKLPKADYEILKTYLVPLLEEAYEKLQKRYRVELEPPVYIEVFSDHQWFSARIVGLGGFPATGACFGNLVALTTPKALPQNWGVVAWHEFAHVITLHATHHRVPRWLTEGLSVFEEGRDHPLWERRFEVELGSAYASGRLLTLAELDFGFSKPKYPMQVLMSYYQGCMVVRYITERWGFEKILDVLKGYKENKSTRNIFREVFDLGLDEFDKGFFKYLDEWVKASGLVPMVVDEKVALGLEIDIEENPEDVSKLLRLAWAYYCAGVEVDVPLTIARVLKLDPGNADAHAILGLQKLRARKTAAAQKDLLKALEAKTRFGFRVNEALGSIAMKNGEKEKAIEFLEKARALSPRAGALQGRTNLYSRLVAHYRESGEEEKMIECLEQWRQVSPEDLRSRLELGKTYLAAGGKESMEKAVKVLNEVIFINPFDLKLHKELARAATQCGANETIIREYKLLLGYPETNPRTAYLALAKAYLELGNKKEAEAFARKVLAIDSGNSAAKEILKQATS